MAEAFANCYGMSDTKKQTVELLHVLMIAQPDSDSHQTPRSASRE